jgi:AGZA family xanthine/uracil permease-like MFS transporter
MDSTPSLQARPSLVNAPSLRIEALAGVTTFFTMVYIVAVNPSILAAQGTGMPFSGVLTATVLLSFVMTLAMGLYARLPFAVAPGMGLNAFFTYSIVLGDGVPWPTALGIVFWAGVLFVLVSVTRLRVALASAIPVHLRSAAAAGIGLFLTFIGLKNAGIVVADTATFVRPGAFTLGTLLSLGGLTLTAWLLHRRRATAFLAGIAAVTASAWLLGLVPAPSSIVAGPDFRSVLLRLDLTGALALPMLPSIVAIMLTDLFDSLSTFIGLSQAAGLVDERGEPRRLREGLLVDAFATLGAGLVGTSPGTAYIESAAGIECGGRTGRTAIFAAVCFLPCLFLAPLAAMVPAFATAPVLILVGALMFRAFAGMPLARIEDAVPAFLTVALIPLTFSITQGMVWGFLSHVGLYAIAGRRREIAPAMVGLAALAMGLLVVEQLRERI